MNDDQIDYLKWTPKYQVFKVLRNLLSDLQTEENLESKRERLCLCIEAAISWEDCLHDAISMTARVTLLRLFLRLQAVYLQFKDWYA